jgi:uncharacterized protein YjbI with pentapeptide repeats
MFNEKPLARLKRNVEKWNQWRKTNYGIAIDIRGANLRKANLCRANLRRANLSEADLSGADLSGADLREADLSKANLSEAHLSKANFSEANLSRADLREAHLLKANFSEANLSEANLSEADLSGAYLGEANLNEAYLSEAYLSEADLSEANLSGANLSQANLSEANLSWANLNEANLSEANLSEAKALKTNFTHANLTGACIRDWNINQGTVFEEVICDYIYYKWGAKRTYQDRRPHDPNKIFNPGDFQRLIETARETVDLIFSDGIDWKAFLESFNALQVEDGQGTLSVKTIEQKDDGSFVIRVKTSANAEEFEKRFYQKYNKLLQQARYYYQKLQLTEHDIQSYQRENANLMKIIELQASQPMIYANNMGVGVNQGEIRGNAKVAGILNEAEQQNLTEIITEVQAIITPLAQTYPNDKTMQGIKTIEVIKNDPNLKQKLINAAQKGGLEFVKKSFDNPVGALIGGAIEGWMGK